MARSHQKGRSLPGQNNKTSKARPPSGNMWWGEEEWELNHKAIFIYKKSTIGIAYER